jgi:hypothetical protein
MIADAISAVVKNTMMAQEKHEAKEKNETQKINLDIDAADAVLRQLVKSNYGSATTWFQKIKGKSGSVSRQNWKAAIQQIGLAVDDETRKAIRKRVARDGSKLINLSQLTSFIDPVESTSTSASDSASELCEIPLEVPSLPDNFHPRDGPLKALVASLVEQQTTTVSSITAPKARNAVSSQGMGGEHTLLVSLLANCQIPRLRQDYHDSSCGEKCSGPQAFRVCCLAGRLTDSKHSRDTSATLYAIVWQQATR